MRIHHTIVALSLTLALAATSVRAEDRPPPPRPLRVAVGQTVWVRMESKRPIKTVYNDKPHIARVQADPDDPTTVLVIGLAPGTTIITLVDKDGFTERRAVGKPPK